MWVLSRGVGPGRGLVAFAHLRLRGSIDSGRLVDAVARLVTARHEFTSRFAFRPDGLVVEQGGSGAATVTTFSATTPIRDVQEAVGSKRFDLAEGPVCHAGVRVDEADGTADVVIAAHHALFDGASDEVVLKALIACYESRSPNDLVAAEAATGSRGDGGSVAARARDLADVPDLPALEQLSFRDLLHRPGAWTSGDLATITHEDVVACARTRRVTPYAVYLAAFGAAVGRVTGSRRFAIGIALARRTEAERNIIGCFVRLVPVRIDLDAPSLLPAVWDDLGRAMASPSIGFSDWGGTRRSRTPRACRSSKRAFLTKAGSAKPSSLLVSPSPPDTSGSWAVTPSTSARSSSRVKTCRRASQLPRATRGMLSAANSPSATRNRSPH
ncbi:condensation domain-containing protein [Curtobacterium sp. 24E2]|nr:hypothetical protein JN350_10895 [Curtobacterium sp. 24E2]